MGKLWGLTREGETQASCYDFKQVLLSSAMSGSLSSYPTVPGTAMGEEQEGEKRKMTQCWMEASLLCVAISPWP